MKILGHKVKGVSVDSDSNENPLEASFYALKSSGYTVKVATVDFENCLQSKRNPLESNF